MRAVIPSSCVRRLRPQLSAVSAICGRAISPSYIHHGPNVRRPPTLHGLIVIIIVFRQVKVLDDHLSVCDTV